MQAPATPSTQATPHATPQAQKRTDPGQLVTSPPETHEAEGGQATRFTSPNLPAIRQSLAARFAGLTLDDNDRAELNLNTEAPAPVQRHPTAVQVPSVRIAPTTRRFMDQQSAPKEAYITPGSLSKGKLALDPEYLCNLYLKNQPRISRLLVEGTHLTPGMAFVLKGACLRKQAGSVELRFPNERTVQARVLDWAEDKVFVELPDITGVPPSTLQIVAITADRRMTAPKAYDFWPNWVLVDVPMHLAQVSECSGFEAKPYVRAWCRAGGRHDIKSRGYEIRSALFGAPGGAPKPRAPIWADRYSEDVLAEDQVGWDTYTLNLPPWAHLQSWQASGLRLANAPKTKVLRYEWDANTRRFTAKWQLIAPGYFGFLEYWVSNFKAWVPAGMRLD